MPPHDHPHHHHPHHGRKGPPRKGPPRHHHHVPSSAITAFVDRPRIDALLAPWVPDAADRAFVVRCILGEGPAHHRGANFVLLALLGQLVEREGRAPGADPAAVAVPLRLPPHLAEAREEEDAYPLAMPTRPIERLAARGTREFEAMVDCLTDGPPQHALANAAMLALLDALLAGDPPRGPER